MRGPGTRASPLAPPGGRDVSLHLVVAVRGGGGWFCFNSSGFTNETKFNITK